MASPTGILFIVICMLVLASLLLWTFKQSRKSQREKHHTKRYSHRAMAAEMSRKLSALRSQLNYRNQPQHEVTLEKGIEGTPIYDLESQYSSYNKLSNPKFEPTNIVITESDIPRPASPPQRGRNHSSPPVPPIPGPGSSPKPAFSGPDPFSNRSTFRAFVETGGDPHSDQLASSSRPQLLKRPSRSHSRQSDVSRLSDPELEYSRRRSQGKSLPRRSGSSEDVELDTVI